MRRAAAALAMALAVASAARADVATPPLPPGAADRLLATLTDAELRAYLRAELDGAARQPEPADAPAAAAFAQAGLRLSALAATATERLGRWTAAVADLPARGADVVARLALATRGPPGMVAACLAVAAAGLGAAAALRWSLVPARPAGQAERFLRATALSLIDLAPVALFVFVTVMVAPLLRGPLGPMWDYLWIWHAGVSAGWAAVAIGRRLALADIPALRLAPLFDATALALELALRRSATVGVGGWLLAGLSPTLGLGIGPAILTVLLAGTLVAALLVAMIAVRRADVARSAAAALGAARFPPEAPARLLAAAAPWALAAYVAASWLYWSAHWLENGVQRLAGPLGGLVALLAVPALDRHAPETAARLTRGSETGRRVEAPLRGALRVALAGSAAVAVLALWGLDLPGLVWGREARRGCGLPRTPRCRSR